MIFVKHQHRDFDSNTYGKECLGNLQIQPPHEEAHQVVSLEHQPMI
jgi:hypothetical protein